MELRDTLLRQLEVAWALASYHLNDLSDDECLWQPAARGLGVRQDAAGAWHTDWPEHEGYDLGPPSIAWIMWHMGYWWSTALDHSFGPRTLQRADVRWPGSAQAARQWIETLHAQWKGRLEELAAEDYLSDRRTHWPFQGRPFADVVAWANVELMKNAAEIGYARFLYGARA